MEKAEAIAALVEQLEEAEKELTSIIADDAWMYDKGESILLDLGEVINQLNWLRVERRQVAKDA